MFLNLYNYLIHIVNISFLNFVFQNDIVDRSEKNTPLSGKLNHCRREWMAKLTTVREHAVHASSLWIPPHQQIYSKLFLLGVSYYSELCSPLTSCRTTLVGRTKWTVFFARDWWCLCPHRWSLNGTLINLGLDRRRRLSGGNLIISSLDRYQDVGMYQCMAYNTVGAILSRRASLQFACKFQFVTFFAKKKKV